MLFGSCGGVEVVVNAMQTYAGVQGVAEGGCGALRNLAANNLDNSMLIGSCGGVDAVVNAMRTYARVQGVAERGCQALANLVNDPSNRTRIISVGGVEVLQSAKRAHASCGTNADFALSKLV